MAGIIDRLNDVASADYAVFHKKIAATNKRVLGVKLPILRTMAKNLTLDEIKKEDTSVYEIVMLYALIAARQDFGTFAEEIDDLLPLFDSWVYVDCAVAGSRALGQRAETLGEDLAFLLDGGTFYKRFYIVAALFFCPQSKAARERIAAVEYGDYYVDMAAAWYISVLFTLDFEAASLYFARFPAQVRKYAKRKCLDSFRLKKEQKAKIRLLKVD